MPAETVAAILQLTSQLFEIVNLSIEHQHIAAVLGMHWLVSFLAKVQNCQTAMPQGHTCLGIGPTAFVVRPAMGQHAGHTPGDLFAIVHATTPRRLTKSHNPTHKSVYLDRG